MSFYDVVYDVAPAVEILRELRQKVAAIREPIYNDVRGPIRDEIAKDVDTFIAPPPGNVVHPFVFMSEASWKWYMWAKRTGEIPGQSWNDEDGSYTRQHVLETAWNIAVNVTSNSAFMSIENDAVDYKGDNYAQAVYGPDPVTGHEDTGWGADFDAQMERIADHLGDMLLESFDDALGAFQNG